MKNIYKILIVFTLFIIVLFGYMAWEGAIYSYEEWRWNKYALDYCNKYNEYSTLDYNLTKNESRALRIYLMIQDTVVEENWGSSYYECCEQLNLNCVRTPSDKIILVLVGEESGFRYVNFNETREVAIDEFLNLRYNNESKYWEWKE